MDAKLIAGITRLLVVRPKLWWTALRQIFRMAPNGWWRHRPFLPIPAPEYLHFRVQTMYGDSRDTPLAADLIDYLEWCHKYPKQGKSRWGRL
jgi:hypothetical protein